MRIAGSCLLIAILAAATSARPTTASTTQPADSPKAALRQWDHRFETCGMETAMQAFHTTNVKEEKLARAMARLSVAMGRMQKAAREKWDAAAATRVVHAAGDATASDIDRAGEEIDKNHAVVSFVDDEFDPIPMVRVDGVWKVDVRALIDDIDGDLDGVCSRTGDYTDSIERGTRAVAAGTYDSVEQVCRMIETQNEKLRAEDKK